MKSICFISNRYPNLLTPTRQVFVQKLVWAMADLGLDCTVISPVPVNQYLKTFHRQPVQATENTPLGATVKLYFPRFISAGQNKLLGINGSHITANLFFNAVRKVWEKLSEQPQVVYGHFLSPAAICASRIGRAFNVPAFAAFGESTPWSIYSFGKEKIKEELKSLRGIISVSTANKKMLTELNLYPQDRIGIFPNAIQNKIFYPRNKQVARDKFGFDREKFLVAYVGQFTERKGVLRVAQALDGIDDLAIAFAGRGKLIPESSNCVHRQSVIPEDMPYFLSAADVFVLPTLNEGCSNAIIEAMACGLPVISSNLPFNEDILNEGNAILIDPNDIGAVRESVLYIKQNPGVREVKSKSAIETAATLTLDARARNISNFIDAMISKK